MTAYVGRHRLIRPPLLDRWDPALYRIATAAETAVAVLAVVTALALLVGAVVATAGVLATGTALIYPRSRLAPITTTRRLPR